MKVLLLTVKLLFSTYDYSFEHGPIVIVEAIGFSINEAVCTVNPDDTNPSCVAYCHVNLDWVTYEDLLPICKDIVK